MADDKVGRYRGGRMTGWEAGMDNRQPDIALVADELRDAVNVDILNGGKLRRRCGISQILADPGAHSLYSDGERLYWATANALKTATASFIPTTALTDVRLAAKLSFTSVNNVTYFSNEAINGALARGVYSPWGIAPPSSAPVCTGAPSGSWYFQVTCTFVLATGEESGAPAGAAVSTSDAYTIAMTSIPQPTDARVTHVRIYVTGVDGDVFFHHMDLPVGVTSYTIRGPFGDGQALRSQFHVPPPAGQLLEQYYNTIFIAVDNLLWYTVPFVFNRVDSLRNVIPFPERITMVKAVNDGLYVSADETYFISNPGTPAMALNPVLPYKAIEGMAMSVPNANDVIWMSQRGIVYGSSGGKVQNLTEDRIAVETIDSGCMGVIEHAGDRRFVASFHDGKPSVMADPGFLAAQALQVHEVR